MRFAKPKLTFKYFTQFHIVRLIILIAVQLLCPSHAFAIDGFMIAVTADPGQIKDGTKVLTEVEKGTRLWVLETRDDRWYLVISPTSKSKGWLFAGEAAKEEISGEASAKLKAASLHFRRYREFKSQRRYEEASRELSQFYEVKKSVYGDDHVEIAVTLNSIGNLEEDLSNYPSAIARHSEALAIKKRYLGLEHESTAISLYNLAIAEKNFGDFDAAEQHYRSALKTNRKLFGDSHDATAKTLKGLANLAERRRDFASARQLYDEVLLTKQKSLGEQHPEVARLQELISSLPETIAPLTEQVRNSAEAGPTKFEALSAADAELQPQESSPAVASNETADAPYVLSPTALKSEEGYVPGPYNFEHRILDISDDRKLAVIGHDRESFDIVDINSGRLTCRLPVSFTDSDHNVTRHARLSHRNNYLWTISPSASNVGILAVSDEIMKEAHAYDELIGKSFRQRYDAATIVAKNGVGLLQWDLNLGEAIGEVNTTNRVTLSFDYWSDGTTEKLVTLEIVADSSKTKGRCLGFYDASTKTRVGEFQLPDNSNWFQDAIRITQRGKCVVVEGERVVAFDISDIRQPRQIWDRKETDTDEYKTAATHVTQESVYFVQETNAYQGIPSKKRVVSVNSWTGRENGRWRIDGDGPFTIDAYRLRMAANGNGLLLIGGPYKRKVAADYSTPQDYSTILLDTTVPGGKTTYIVGRVFEEFGPDNELITNDRISDVAKRRSRTLERQKLTVDGVPLLTGNELQGTLIADSPSLSVVANGGDLLVIDKTNGNQLAAIPSQRLSEVAGTSDLYALQRASGIFSTEQAALYIAVPREISDAEGKMLDIKSKQHMGSLSGYATTNEKLRRTLECIEGIEWNLFSVSTVDFEVRELCSTKPSVWTRIVELDGCLAVVSLSSMHETLRVGLLDADGVFSETWKASNPLAPRSIELLIRNHMDFAYVSIDPMLKMRVASRGNKLCVFCGLGTHNSSGGAVLHRFNDEGKLTETKTLNNIPHPLSQFLGARETEHIDDGAVFLWVQGDPLAFDYCPNTNEVVTLSYPPSLMSSMSMADTRYEALGDIASSVDKPSMSIGLRVQRFDELAEKTFDVIRHTEAGAFSRGIPNNFDQSLPDTPGLTRFEVDDSGIFAWLEYSVIDEFAMLVHLPTLTQIARVRKPASFAMGEDGTLITKGGAIPLSKLREFGLKVFDESIVSEKPNEVPFDLPPLEQPKASSHLYYLGVSGSDFEDDRFSSLQYCVDDIREVGRSLRNRAVANSMAFTPWIMSAPSIRSLSVEERLAELVATAQPADTVVLAFATHGVRLKRGLYLILPQSRYASPQGTAVGWPLVAKAIEKLKAHRVIVLLDTCHAASFSESSTELLQQVQSDLRSRAGLTVLASCRADQKALELDDKRHGAFTYSLLSTFAEDGFPLDMDPATFEKLANKVRSLTDGQQEPVLLINNAFPKK